MQRRIPVAILASVASFAVFPGHAAAVQVDYNFSSTPPYSVSCKLKLTDGVTTSGSTRNILWNQNLRCTRPLGRAYLYGKLTKLNLQGQFTEVEDDGPEECFIATSPFCASGFDSLGVGQQTLSQTPGTYRNESFIILNIPGSETGDPWAPHPGCVVSQNGMQIACDLSAPILVPGP